MQWEVSEVRSISLRGQMSVNIIWVCSTVKWVFEKSTVLFPECKAHFSPKGVLCLAGCSKKPIMLR